jgi:hypothetical protein
MCPVLNSLKSSPGPGLARTEIVLRFGLWYYDSSAAYIIDTVYLKNPSLPPFPVK